MNKEEKESLKFLEEQARIGVYHEAWGRDQHEAGNKLINKSVKIIRRGLKK